jgi:hypothetical protein
MTKPKRPQQVNIVPAPPAFNLVWLGHHADPEQFSFTRIPIIAWQIETDFYKDKDELSTWSSLALPITPDQPVDVLVYHQWAVEYPNGACLIPRGRCGPFRDVNELLEHWKAEARAGGEYRRDPGGKIQKVFLQ